MNVPGVREEAPFALSLSKGFDEPVLSNVEGPSQNGFVF